MSGVHPKYVYHVSKRSSVRHSVSKMIQSDGVVEKPRSGDSVELSLELFGVRPLARGVVMACDPEHGKILVKWVDE